MRIVQLTDLHLLPTSEASLHSVDPWLGLEEAMVRVLALTPRPAVVLLTGDIAEAGDAASYLRVRTFFEHLPFKVFALPGNHDDGAVMRESLRDSNIVCTSHAVVAECLFIFVDSTVEHASHGFISSQRLEHVAELLELHPNKAVVVALHHAMSSPCPSRGCQLLNADELLSQLQRSGRPMTVISGHLHCELDEQRGSLRLLTSPSTFAQCQHPDGEPNSVPERSSPPHVLNPTRRGFRVLEVEGTSTSTEVHWF